MNTQYSLNLYIKLYFASIFARFRLFFDFQFFPRVALELWNSRNLCFKYCVFSRL